jgi:uncharacterized protein (DUF983 family)
LENTIPYGICPKCGTTVLFHQTRSQDANSCIACGTMTPAAGSYDKKTQVMTKFDGTVITTFSEFAARQRACGSPFLHRAARS